jgi:hypothetical protein
MNRRTLVYGFLSTAVGVILLGYLLARADLDVAATARLILSLRAEALAEVTLLLALNGFLAAEKWRLIDRHLGEPGRAQMPRLLYFAFTSIGVGLGQIVPAQLSLAFCRSIGAHFYGGRGLMRGATGTLFDQFFDILVALLFGLASVVVLLTGGGAMTWVFCAVVISVAGWLEYGAAARLVTGAARSLGCRGSGRFYGYCASLGHSPLFAPGIGRRLFAITTLRFAILVLVSIVAANAAGVDVPAWHLSASLPFAIVAGALAITPGGLGVIEWTASSALFAFGTPFQVSAQWAIVNRLLVALAAGLCGVAGLLIAAAARSSRPRRAV